MDIFSQVKEIPIQDVIERFNITDLKRIGNSWEGLCPFHQERTPSFKIRSSKNSWKCFGCGEGGSSIDLIAKLHRLQPLEAAKLIAQEYGIAVSNVSPSKLKDYRKQKKMQKEDERLVKAFENWSKRASHNINYLQQLIRQSIKTCKVESDLDNVFIELVKKDYLFEHWKDILLFGTIEEKLNLYNDPKVRGWTD